MESLKLIEYLAAGGDIATIGVFFALIKLHTRLTRVETQLDLMKA